MIMKPHKCGKWELQLSEPRLDIIFDGQNWVSHSGDVRRDLKDLKYLIEHALDQPDLTPMGYKEP